MPAIAVDRVVSPPRFDAACVEAVQWIRTNAGFALLILALIAGFRQMFLPGMAFGRGNEMAAIARNLAEHGIFGNPFAPALTGPTAVVPPLYPAFLAVLIKIFGLNSIYLIIAANIFANALIAALMPRLSARFYGDAAPGFFAGLLWIASMRLLPQWDMSFTILGVVVFCLFTAARIEGRQRIWWSPASAGLLAGLLSLMNPAIILVLVPWVAFQLWSRRAGFQFAARYASLLVLTAVLCNVPWMLRNYRIWHAPVLRTNFGMTIYSSNNDCAQSSLERSGKNGCYQSTHPVASDSEIALLRELGEVQYDRRRTADTLRWIQANPVRFRELTVTRAIEFWFPDGLGETAYGFWLGTLLSVPGIILMGLRRQAVTLFVLFVWLIYPLIYYVVVSIDRYRYPILWTSLLPAGYCLFALLTTALRWTRPAIFAKSVVS